MNYINSNGTMNDIGYIADFECDEALHDYLQSYFSDEEIRNQLEEDNKASIGYLFFNEYSLDTVPNIVAFSFMAATKNMSSLFKDSASVFNWFMELSRLSNSILTYIDFEHLGFKIVFHKGAEVNININYENLDYDCINIPHYHEIMDDFSKYAKDYFHGQ